MRLLSITCAPVLAAITLLYVGFAVTLAYAIDSGPNNGIAEAEGPLTGGVEYTGTIGTSNDIDTYLFYVSGEVALDVHVANISSTCVSVTLGNADNSKSLDYQHGGWLKEGQNTDLTYTTSPGVSRFYLQFEQSCYPKETGAYSFSISPPGAIIGGPATPTARPVSGLHENSGQAFGPLAANTAYSDALLTSNDQNWLTFFTPASAESVEIEATALVENRTSCGYLSVDHTELPLAGNEWTHYTFTSTGSAQHFISNATCNRWEVIVNTPSLATGLQTAPRTPPQCVVPRFLPRTSLKGIEHKIRAVHCAVGKIGATPSRTVRQGTVVRLSPSPGSKHAAGTAVNITVSSGPPCVVPSVNSGVSLKTMEHRVVAAHCAVGKISYLPSTHARRGVVIRLTPKPGTTLSPHAAVGVFVSSGRPRHHKR